MFKKLPQEILYPTVRLVKKESWFNWSATIHPSSLPLIFNELKTTKFEDTVPLPHSAEETKEAEEESEVVQQGFKIAFYKINL